MSCNYRWYTYIVALIFIIMAQIVGAYPYALYVNHHNIHDGGGIITQALCLLPFVAGFGALWFSMRYIHRDTFKSTITSRTGVDYSRVCFGFISWLILTVIYTAITPLLHPEMEIEWSFSPPQFLLLLIIGVTLLPIQTTFEELLFRGYIYRGILRYIGNRWVSMTIVAIIFAGMHLSNPEIITFGFWTMLAQYLVMALIFGVIACWDRGTEVTIGMHFANNLFCMAFVVTEGTAFTSDGALFRVASPINDYKDTVIIGVAGVIMVGLYYWRYIHKHKQKTDQIS